MGTFVCVVERYQIWHCPVYYYCIFIIIQNFWIFSPSNTKYLHQVGFWSTWEIMQVFFVSFSFWRPGGAFWSCRMECGSSESWFWLDLGESIGTGMSRRNLSILVERQILQSWLPSALAQSTLPGEVHPQARLKIENLFNCLLPIQGNLISQGCKTQVAEGPVHFIRSNRFKLFLDTKATASGTSTRLVLPDSKTCYRFLQE